VKAGKARRTGLPWPLVAAVATTRVRPKQNRTNDSGVALKDSGIAGALAFHISPEIGYFVSDSLLLSLQGRFQIVTGGSQINGSAVTSSKDACKGGVCHPAIYALAGLAKLTWFIGEPKKVTPFVSLAAGAGQIRHVVSLPSKDPANPSKPYLLGCPSSGCVDTVVGGPVLFGPGGGITVELSDSFLIVASTNVLVGRAPHDGQRRPERWSCLREVGMSSRPPSCVA